MTVHNVNTEQDRQHASKSTRDPGDYHGRHRFEGTNGYQKWMGCELCKAEIA